VSLPLEAAKAGSTTVRAPSGVYGLLCNREGCPIAVEVFEGGAAAPMTLASQVRKLKARDHWTPTRDTGICSLLRTGVRLFGTAPPT